MNPKELNDICVCRALRREPGATLQVEGSIPRRETARRAKARRVKLAAGWKTVPPALYANRAVKTRVIRSRSVRNGTKTMFAGPRRVATRVRVMRSS